MSNNLPETHKRLVTRWADDRQERLTTRLEEAPFPDLKFGEIAVEMLYVPMHGSFWLSTHPDAIHPRSAEFMEGGHFVFGNGGVGRVIATQEDPRLVKPGDYVCVFGHVPCNHYDCYACTVLHRYTECDYGESGIIGHGKGAPDGTYSNYAVLPKHSYNVCFRAEETPTEEDLMPFMFAFLVADVRNALTRHPDSLRQRRMMLVGAGFSGEIAAYIHNKSVPEAKCFAVDGSAKRLERIRAIDPESIRTYTLPPKVIAELNSGHRDPDFRHDLQETIDELAAERDAFLGENRCNLLFDGSSGNSTPLWDNKRILNPTMHCIPFGFGSHYILLSKEIVQMSGLNIIMSRGVGNIRNRQETIQLIKAGASKFLYQNLISTSRRLNGMDEVAAFVKEQHEPPKAIHEIPHAYFCPNPHS